jgi:hypothetical protein
VLFSPNLCLLLRHASSGEPFDESVGVEDRARHDLNLISGARFGKQACAWTGPVLRDQALMRRPHFSQ